MAYEQTDVRFIIVLRSTQQSINDNRLRCEAHVRVVVLFPWAIYLENNVFKTLIIITYLYIYIYNKTNEYYEIKINTELLYKMCLFTIRFD